MFSSLFATLSKKLSLVIKTFSNTLSLARSLGKSFRCFVFNFVSLSGTFLKYQITMILARYRFFPCRKTFEISWSFRERENWRALCFGCTFKKCSSKKFIDFDIARISFAFLHSIIVRCNRRGMLPARVMFTIFCFNKQRFRHQLNNN